MTAGCVYLFMNPSSQGQGPRTEPAPGGLRPAAPVLAMSLLAMPLPAAHLPGVRRAGALYSGRQAGAGAAPVDLLIFGSAIGPAASRTVASPSTQALVFPALNDSSRGATRLETPSIQGAEPAPGSHLTARATAAGQPDPAARAERDARLAELMRQAATGSTSAFETFYEATLAPARAFARRMVRPDDLDDLLADAFFQAWREAPRFDAARGCAVSWLLMIVRSRALDLLRRQKAAREVELADDAPDLIDEAPGPDELLSGTQAGTRLHAALADLAPAERWMLGLAYYRDLSHSEIATVTGVALGTVKSIIRRAQEKLRTRLLST